MSKWVYDTRLLFLIVAQVNINMLSSYDSDCVSYWSKGFAIWSS